MAEHGTTEQLEYRWRDRAATYYFKLPSLVEENYTG